MQSCIGSAVVMSRDHSYVLCQTYNMLSVAIAVRFNKPVEHLCREFNGPTIIKLIPESLFSAGLMKDDIVSKNYVSKI